MVNLFSFFGSHGDLRAHSYQSYSPLTQDEERRGNKNPCNSKQGLKVGKLSSGAISGMEGMGEKPVVHGDHYIEKITLEKLFERRDTMQGFIVL